MYYVNLFLIISAAISPSAAADLSRVKAFNIFGAIANVFGGLSSIGHMFSSLSDVFSAVLNEYPTVIPTNSSVPIPEDAFLDIIELATKYGYVIEEHKVTTEDGYILTLHRIPYGKSGHKNNLTVFLMHGILDSSDSWLIQGPDKALAYILADQGFDVWMGNARGNKHALSHVSLKPNQSEFWTFTWEEIGVFDLSAMIDYALNYTGSEGLYYVGHSQGTTSYYVLNSLRPEYNDKIKMMFSLAPVAWVTHAKSPIIRVFSPAYEILAYLLSNFNTYSPTTEFFNKISAIACSLIPNRCSNIMYLIIGNDYKHINESIIPIIFAHMPSGSSTQQFVHYGQLMQSGRFCRYDYGKKENLERYGTLTPPEYDLSVIKVPTVLYYSGNDWLSDPADVEKLKNKLNVCGDHYIQDFNHLDFLYASNAKVVIYSSIIAQIRHRENVMRESKARIISA